EVTERFFLYAPHGAYMALYVFGYAKTIVFVNLTLHSQLLEPLQLCIRLAGNVSVALLHRGQGAYDVVNSWQSDSTGLSRHDPLRFLTITLRQAQYRGGER